MRLRRTLGAALATVAALGWLSQSHAAAAPVLVRVGAHVSGFHPALLAVAPDGSAYVQGVAAEGGPLLPTVWVFGAAGQLLRTLAIPGGARVAAVGNGQLYAYDLYAYDSFAGSVFGVSLLNGAITSEVGLPTPSYPGRLGFPDGVVVDAGGTVYESGGEVSIAGPGQPAEPAPAIQLFNAGGVYGGFIEPRFPAGADVALSAVNAVGDLLGSWANPNGQEVVGAFSPSGMLLGRFRARRPRMQVRGAAFAPAGNAIYAGAETLGGSKQTVAIAKLSFAGKLVERFGERVVHDVANPDLYEGVRIAANGDGWALRSRSLSLYRFTINTAA
jgi:hypothetical protein